MGYGSKLTSTSHVRPVQRGTGAVFTVGGVWQCWLLGFRLQSDHHSCLWGSTGSSNLFKVVLLGLFKLEKILNLALNKPCWH